MTILKRRDECLVNKEQPSPTGAYQDLWASLTTPATPNIPPGSTTTATPVEMLDPAIASMSPYSAGGGSSAKDLETSLKAMLNIGGEPCQFHLDGEVVEGLATPANNPLLDLLSRQSFCTELIAAMVAAGRTAPR